MDINVIYTGNSSAFQNTLEKVCEKRNISFEKSEEISQKPYKKCFNNIIFFDNDQNIATDTPFAIAVQTANTTTCQAGITPLDLVPPECPLEILDSKITLYFNHLRAKKAELFPQEINGLISDMEDNAPQINNNENIIIERFKKISSISRKINSLDIDKIARACVEEIPEIFHANYSSIYTYDKNSNCLHLLRHNHPHKISSLIDVAKNESRPMCQAVLNKKMMIIEDLKDSNNNKVNFEHEDSSTTNYRTNSCVIAPLMSSDSVLGVLNLADKSDMSNFEKQTDLPALELLCEIAGAALQNLELYRKINRQAQTDGMTGLVNHITFYNTLNREVERFIRYKHNLSLVMIDMDGLKTINDKYGHIGGDTVICHVADKIKNCVRKTDIAARYGGDEFAVILPETSLEHAQKLANRLLAMVEQDKVTFKGEVIPSTVSIGIGQCKPDQSVEEFVDSIDSALFDAKESGKNRVVIA